MENANGVSSASVSNNPPHQTRSESEKNSSFVRETNIEETDIFTECNEKNTQAVFGTEDDTGSIISLVNQLRFNIDDKDKAQFFAELENTLAEQAESDDISNNHELITFFIKHTKPNGQISA